jgi:hypothetical protein
MNLLNAIYIYIYNKVILCVVQLDVVKKQKNQIQMKLHPIFLN